MQGLNDELPELIFMDIVLTGPDGFSFLNELISYKDTAEVPVVVVSALNLEKYNLNIYGVVGILNKDTMKPEDIKGYVTKYAQ
jgi:CheY-like chemotaxis protein